MSKPKPPTSTDKMLDYLRESAQTILKREPKAPVIRVPRPQTKTGVRAGDCPPPHRGF